MAGVPRWKYMALYEKILENPNAAKEMGITLKTNHHLDDGTIITETVGYVEGETEEA